MNIFQCLDSINNRINSLNYFLTNSKQKGLPDYLQGALDILKILGNKDNIENEVLYKHILQKIDEAWKVNADNNIENISKTNKKLIEKYEDILLQISLNIDELTFSNDGLADFPEIKEILELCKTNINT